MKRKKVFTIGAIGLMVGVVTEGVRNSVAKTVCDELTMLNVEGLSMDEGGSGFNCIMEKDECKFKVETEAEVSAIKKMFASASLTIGAEVDLSCGTQIYREKRFWESGVRCGADVTCNDLLNQMGLTTK